MLRAGVVVALTSVGVVFFANGVARASNPLASVRCTVAQSVCDVGAATTETAPSAPGATPLTPATANKERTCTIPGVAGTVPCSDPNLGWLASDGCYYKPNPGFVPPAVLASEAMPGVAGGWYDRLCDWISTGSDTVWRPDAAMGAVIPVDPATLARRAAAQLRAPMPVVATSPALAAGTQVGVPVWLWIDAAGWRSVSATAAVPGVSVTATATPVSVVWDFGGAGRVTCVGPGSPFRPGVDDPAGSSPTCGFTPGRPGRWPVTVTESWRVAWAGAGEGGTLPALTTRTTAVLPVGETEALVGAGGGR